MGMLFVKFLPYIWPLLKEFLEGKKDHPYFKDGVRAKSKAKIVSFILLVTVLAVGSWAYDLHLSNAELLKKLEDSKKAPAVSEKTYSRADLDLALCAKDLTDAKLKLAETQGELVSNKAKVTQCQAELEWSLHNPTQPVKPTPQPKPKKPAIGEEAQKQLDQLSKSESNNAPH